MTTKHTIVLRLGDWSDDGHGKTACFYITSNIPIIALGKAYAKGVKNVGIDIVSYCNQYEEWSLPKEAVQKLLDAGCKLEDHVDSWAFKEWLKGTTPDEELSMDTHSFTNIWLWIASQGDADFEWRMIKEDRLIIDIGGYGLFS